MTFAAAGSLLRVAGSLLSPAGHRGRLAILIFHQVLQRPDPMRPDAPDAELFAQQLDVLAQHFRVLPLVDAIEGLRRGALPARAACITFDDGYADNVEVALPLLQQRQIHATFFIATGFLDNDCMWNDRIIEAVRDAPGERLDLSQIGLGIYSLAGWEERRRTAETLIGTLKYLRVAERQEKVQSVAMTCRVDRPAQLMMTRAQLQTLSAAGMDIGGHTVNHPILAATDLKSARAEISRGREELAGLLGRNIDLFAYPNGRPGRDYAAEHTKLVRELGFRAAVSTAWGAARCGHDLYQLPRFTPWDKTRLRFVLRLFRNYSAPIALV